MKTERDMTTDSTGDSTANSSASSTGGSIVHPTLSSTSNSAGGLTVSPNTSSISTAIAIESRVEVQPEVQLDSQSNTQGAKQSSNNSATDLAPQSSSDSSSDSRRRELADFLRNRREKRKPQTDAATLSVRRRTPGLRREEVAELAGVGTTWYTWLEQARDIQPSAEVLRRLGLALQLTPAELRHMFALAGKASPNDSIDTCDAVSPSLRHLFRVGLQVPAILLGYRWDILELNEAASQKFGHLNKLAPEKRNWISYIFTSSTARERLPDWATHARRLVGEFRSTLGDCLDHPTVASFIDRIRSESVEFDEWWKDHEIREPAPVRVDINDAESGLKHYERNILLASECARIKILTFTPVSV